MNAKIKSEDTETLRKRAEELLRALTTEIEENPEGLSPKEMRRTLHELRVHQIELEMQNDELRRAHAELDAERANFFDFYDLAPMGYFSISEQGLIQKANLTAAKMLGVNRAELIEQKITQFIHRNDQDSLYLFNKKLFDTRKAQVCELRILRKDGTVCWVSLNAIVFQGAHCKPICRFTMTDITERKLANELKNRIQRIIHHDLRTPACGAMNIATMIKSQPNITEEQRKLFCLFEDAGRNMLDTLDSFLDLYKIETGNYTPNPKPFSCLVVLNKLVETQMRDAKFGGVDIDVQFNGKPLTPDTICTCLGEEHLFRMAIQNLLINALEASTPGAEVTIEVSPGNGCLIEIYNKGVVPADIRDKFFEKYVTSGKHNGNGIGTYAAKMMVKAMGGDITMRTSDVDNETTVTVKMPAKQEV